MGKLDIKQTIEVETSASKAWEVIGPNFLNIAEWGRGIHKSWDNEAAAKNFSDAPSGGRHCDVAGLGKLDEEILHYDAEKYEITWSASGEKLPGFISGLQNALVVEAIDENSCRATSNITANTSGLRGFLLAPIFKKNFSKVLGGFLHDWKTYAETGRVSETKQRELAKAEK